MVTCNINKKKTIYAYYIIYIFKHNINNACLSNKNKIIIYHSYLPILIYILTQEYEYMYYVSNTYDLKY